MRCSPPLPPLVPWNALALVERDRVLAPGATAMLVSWDCMLGCAALIAGATARAAVVISLQRCHQFLLYVQFFNSSFEGQ